jgi:5-methylcytosine-specific restriction endonuclease McrA
MPRAGTHGRKGRPWRRIRAQVIAAAVGSPCAECGKPLQPPGTWPYRHPLSLSVDHIEPLSKAPERAHDPTNLRCLHLGCNSSLGASLGNSEPTHDPYARDDTAATRPAANTHHGRYRGASWLDENGLIPGLPTINRKW